MPVERAAISQATFARSLTTTGTVTLPWDSPWACSRGGGMERTMQKDYKQQPSKHSSISTSTQKLLLCGFSKHWPKRSYCSTNAKKFNKNICHTPSSSLEIACACGWKFSLHSPAVNLLSHPSSLPSLFPPFQSSCLKPHPQLHKQHEGAYRSRNWTCLLTSAPAEVCARNGYECQSSWYGHSPVPFISTVVLSHIAPLPI